MGVYVRFAEQNNNVSHLSLLCWDRLSLSFFPSLFLSTPLSTRIPLSLCMSLLLSQRLSPLLYSNASDKGKERERGGKEV